MLEPLRDDFLERYDKCVRAAQQPRGASKLNGFARIS